MRSISSCLRKSLLVPILIAAFMAALALAACDDGGQIAQPDETVDGADLFSEEVAVEETSPEPAPDMTQQLQDLLDQSEGEFEAMKNALQAQIDALQKQLADKTALDAAALAEAQEQLEEYIAQQKELDAAEKELAAAEGLVEEKEAELEELEDAKTAKDAEDAETLEASKVDSLQLRVKVASSASDGGTDLPLTVSFCKDRDTCGEPMILKGGSAEGSQNDLDTASVATGTQSDILTAMAEGVDAAMDEMEDEGEGIVITKDLTADELKYLTKEDLSVIKFCIGDGDDQLYIGAVMVIANDEVWYINPTFFRMLDEGSCTNAIRDEDVFVGFFSRTDDYDLFSWNDGTDDSIGLNFTVSGCSPEAAGDIAADFQGADEMNKKYYEDGLFKGRFDSESDDFEHSDRGFYGFSGPVADCIDFNSVTLVAYGDDYWDYEPIEIYAGTVMDLIEDYNTACHHLKSDNDMGDELDLTMDAKGSCLDLKDLGKKDYTGGMGNGDLAPPEWFTDLTDYQQTGKISTPAPVDEEVTASDEAVVEAPPPAEIVAAEAGVAAAVKAAYDIAGVDPETDVLNIDSVLAKLNASIDEKKGLFDNTSDECYNKQVQELMKREHGITLAFMRATTAALTATAHLIDMKIENIAPTGTDGAIDSAKLQASLTGVEEESGKATVQKDLATALCDSPLAEMCTAAEKNAAAEAAAQPAATTPAEGTPA